MPVRSLGGEDPHPGGHSNPLQYSCLENSVDGGAWWATVHGVAESSTQVSTYTVSVDFLSIDFFVCI